MTTALLNLPNRETIQRRYMCSYNAPNMLFPPQELMALGGIVKSWKTGTAHLIDAIAENISIEQSIQRLKKINPDLIVTLSGFECFEEDMNAFAEIKKALPHSKTILFGHYASLFAKEILNHFDFDFIILDEPDLKFSSLYDALEGKIHLSEVQGVAYKDSTGIKIQTGEDRIRHPEELPMPAYELLQADKYFEPFLSGPFGLIQSARGCPYSCNYCVKSFGQKLTYRTSDQIISEIIFLKEKFGIRSLRFIDDTFTVSPRRVMEVCQKMIDHQLNIEWTCLSRTDTLREEMLPLMKRAGCKRIYFGVESGSPKVLKYLDKEMDVQQSLQNLKSCKQHGIETLGFFLVGAPVETDEDFEMSVNYAIDADLDYVVVSAIIPYPGTPFFETLKEEIDFSILPYKNEWRDQSLTLRAKEREKEFYRRYYFRQRYMKNSLGRISRHPVDFIKNSAKLASFMLKGRAMQKRNDYM